MIKTKIILPIAIISILLSIAFNHNLHQSISIKLRAAILPNLLVTLTNNDRTNNGLPTLKNSSLLQKAAQLKANDMAEKGYFSHNSPDGKTPWYWLNQAGYKYLHAGENLAVKFSTSEGVESAWMKSPTHKANILNNKYSEIGIATAQGIYKGKHTTFVVQLFGEPQPTLASIKSSQQENATVKTTITNVEINKTTDLNSSTKPNIIEPSNSEPIDIPTNTIVAIEKVETEKLPKASLIVSLNEPEATKEPQITNISKPIPTPKQTSKPTYKTTEKQATTIISDTKIKQTSQIENQVDSQDKNQKGKVKAAVTNAPINTEFISILYSITVNKIYNLLPIHF